MRSGCLSGDGRDGENTDVGILLWKVVVNVERELENVRNSTWYSRQRTVWQCCKDYCTRTRQVWRHGAVVVMTNNTKHIMQSEIRRTWGKSNVKISERQHWKFYFDDFKTGVTSVLEIRINTRSIKLLPRIRVKNSEELSEKRMLFSHLQNVTENKEFYGKCAHVIVLWSFQCIQILHCTFCC